MAFAPPTTVIQHLKAGRMKALAYTGAKRWAVMPDVPAVAETVPGFVFEAAWHGMFAPAGTPPAIVSRIQGNVAKATQNPKIREFYEAGGYVIVADTPAEFRDVPQEVFCGDGGAHASEPRCSRSDGRMEQTRFWRGKGEHDWLSR